MMQVNKFVELPDEVDGLEVFAPAVDVRQPLTFLARIIQVEHRRHRVNPQPVDVIFLQPEQRVAQQKVSHFVPPVVEDQGAPLLVLAFARVGVFVQMRAVEVGQAVPVFRKVGRHPIQNHAYAVAMAVIDEVRELVGLAVA